MRHTRYSKGFTLVEIMIVVAIIGILAAIAIPAYNGYIKTSETNACDTNAHSLASFEDNYFYDNNTYLAGTYGGGQPDTLTAALGWTPSGDQNKYQYAVTAGATGIGNSYTVTVTYVPNPSIIATVSRP